MKIAKKLRVLFTLPFTTRILLLEAFLFLGWARVLKLFPFSKVAPSLGTKWDETPLDKIQNKELIISISDAIHIMSRYTFWESMCLVKAIAAMKMLERRHIESTLYLGTAKDVTGNMIAHAWLRSGPYFITGAEEMNKFTVVGKFAKKISN